MTQFTYFTVTEKEACLTATTDSCTCLPGLSLDMENKTPSRILVPNNRARNLRLPYINAQEPGA